VTLLLAAAALVFVVFAFIALRSAWRGAEVLFRLRKSRPRPIAQAADGPIEIEGTIHAVGDPIRSPSGRACVAAKITISVHSKENPRAVLTTRTTDLFTKAIVRDATGEIAADLPHLELVAPRVVGRGDRSELVAPWGDDLPRDGGAVVVTEVCIEDGARVVVSGTARTIRSDVAASAEGGYRGAEPAIVATRQIEGSPNDRVVLSAGSRSELVRRAALPVALLVGCALGFLGYAASALRALTW
jgi:hypothetical protein